MRLLKHRNIMRRTICGLLTILIMACIALFRFCSMEHDSLMHSSNVEIAKDDNKMVVIAACKANNVNQMRTMSKYLSKADIEHDIISGKACILRVNSKHASSALFVLEILKASDTTLRGVNLVRLK